MNKLTCYGTKDRGDQYWMFLVLNVPLIFEVLNLGFLSDDNLISVGFWVVFSGNVLFTCESARNILILIFMILGPKSNLLCPPMEVDYERYFSDHFYAIIWREF